MNTARIITALFYAETALLHAFRLRRWDSERHAAKLLCYRIRNLRQALDQAYAHKAAQLLAA